MVRTIFFYSYFWLSLAATTPLALLYVIFWLIGLRHPAQVAAQALARGWALSVVWATGARVSISGAERMPKTGGVCLVGNHQGTLEIPMMIAFMPRVPGFVAKKESLFLPFINIWIAALGGIFIDRGNLKNAQAAITKGAARLKKGGAVLIYPEGTRSRCDGLGVFKKGAFKLATLAEVPIVPVTVDGSWRVWEEHSRIRPAEVKLTVHEPITTAGLGAEEKRALPEKVRAVIASALPKPDQPLLSRSARCKAPAATGTAAQADDT